MSHVEMGLTMGAWQLVYIAAALPSGMLLDKIGSRRALALGGLLVAVSALMRGYATDSTSMIAAVMVFGLGGPIISAGAPKVIVENFIGARRGLAMGIYMTGPAIGGVISLTATHSVLLPFFDQDWRSVMLLWFACSIVASFVWFVLAGKQPQLTDNAPSATGSSQIQVVKGLIRKPTVMIVLAMSVSVFLFTHGLNNWLPEMLRAHGMTAINAGYWAAIPTVIGIFGSLLIPGLATPSRRFYILIALSCIAFLSSVMLRSDNEGILLVGLMLQGLVRSSLMTVLVLTLVELPEIGEKYVGVASGIFFTASQFGGVLGPLLIGMLYSPSTGFSSGLWLLTCVSMTMIFGSVWLQKRAASHA